MAQISLHCQHEERLIVSMKKAKVLSDLFSTHSEKTGRTDTLADQRLSWALRPNPYPCDAAAHIQQNFLMSKSQQISKSGDCGSFDLSRIPTKPVFGVSDQVRYKRGCTVIEDS